MAILVNTLTLTGTAETASLSPGAASISLNTITLTGTPVEAYPLINVISPTQLTWLRDNDHELKIWGSVLVPLSAWSARINDPAATRGTTVIAFDGGAGSNLGVIGGNQEIWIGTTAGAKDICTLRLRSGVTTGDGGVTGSVTVANHPWILADDQYLTFKFDYPLRQKYPYIETDGTFKKDRNIAYTNENTQPTPITICGTDRAGWLDAGTGDIVFNVDVSQSYAIASGATITGYECSVSPSAGSSVSFSTSTGIGTITFTTTGQRWVRFRSSDSNGQVQDSWRCYWVHDPDPVGNDHPMFEFSAIRLNGDWDRGGWNASFLAHNDATLTDIPDEARILLWAESKYGAIEQSITLLPTNNVETVFNGYIVRETADQDLNAGTGTVGFELFTIQEILRRFNFSVSLEAVQSTPSTWWQYEEWLTTGRAIHHLWKHHSTLTGNVDILGLTDNTMPRGYTEFEEGDLYSMADGFANQRSIRARVVCDVGGRIHLVQDVQLLTDAERLTKKTIMPITVDDLSGKIELRREPINQAAFVKVSGFVWDGTTFTTNENNEIVPDAQPICASAPGLVPAYEGSSVYVLDRQTFTSQTNANDIAGRVYAQQNNEYRPLPLNFHGNYHGVFDVAYDHWYTMSLQAGDTERGIIWTDQRMACRNVSVIFDSEKGTAGVNAVFEVEMSSITGEPAFCMDDVPEYGGDLPDIVDEEIPDALITGGSGSSIYFKDGYQSSWSQRSTRGVEDLIQDPFWPAKQNSVASNDAILIKCGQGFIRRSTDGGQTWAIVTPTTNPPNDAGDAPAPTVGQVTFNQLDGSYTYTDEFVAMVTWQNSSSEWRTWLYYSDDSFATNGTWLAIIGNAGNNLTGWNTPSTHIEGTDNGQTEYADAGWSQGNLIQSLIKMTDTKYVVVYWVDRFPTPTETFWGYARVLDIQTDGSISVGAEYGPWSYTGGPFDGNAIIQFKAYAWDEDYFIIVSMESDSEFWPPPGCATGLWGYAVVARAGSVNGQVITFGSRYLVENHEPGGAACADFYTFDQSFVKLPGTNYGVISATSWYISPANNQNPSYTWVVFKSALTRVLSIGPMQTWVNAPFQTPSGIGCDIPHLVAIDDSTFAIFFTTSYDDGDGTWQLYVVHATVNKIIQSCNFEAPQYINFVLSGSVVDWVKVDALNPNKFIVVVDPGGTFGGLGSFIVNRSGTTYTNVGGETIIETNYTSTPYWNFNVVAMSGTQWMVVYDSWDATNLEIRARVGYLTGSASHAYGSKIAFDEVNDDEPPTVYRENQRVTAFPSLNHIVASFGDQETIWNIRAITADLTLGWQAKGLGISLSKGSTGLRVWMTLWDDAYGLSLVDIDIATMTIWEKWSLGQATEAEINNGTYIAYPFGGIGDDDWVIVYGRMKDAYGFGDPTHVIESSTGGVSAEHVEPDSTWSDGTGVCTALWAEPDGSIYAIRNLGSSSKLYYGNSIVGIGLMSTLAFPAGVNPHGIKIDPYDLSVYAASDVAQSIMILKSFPLYTSWINMTYDHGIASDVQSLELL